MRPRDLGGLFPTKISDLLEDSYYSINGMRGKWRNAKLCVNLNAAWLDCDYHDCPDPYGTAKIGLAKMLALDAIGEIPHPTLYVESGRGFWVFWRLRDENGNRLEADKTNRLLWARLGRHIADCARTFGFPVDGNAGGEARLTRMPESINTKAQQKVVYRISAGPDGQPITYTLPALVRFFNVPAEPALPAPAPKVSLRPMPASLAIRPRSKLTVRAASGHRALRERRLRDLETLMELRGGRFKLGCRENATYLYAIFLRGTPDGEARVRSFAKERCTPPLEEYGIRAAIKHFKQSPRNLTDLKIGSWLNITSAEAESLEGSKQEGGFTYLTPQVVHPSARKLSAANRRAIILSVCPNGYSRLSLRKLVESLRDQGCSSNIETVRRDLVALGITNPRKPLDKDRMPLFSSKAVLSQEGGNISP
jgi:hypothetical protein